MSSGKMETKSSLPNTILGNNVVRCLTLLIILILPACNSSREVATSTPNSAVTASLTRPTELSPTNTVVSSSKSVEPVQLTGSITPLISPAVTTVTSSPDWQLDWLNGIPCRPPCLANIIPGRTTAAEALKILKQNHRVASAQMSIYNSYGSIEWSWTLTSPRSINGHGGSADFESNSPSQVIYLINLDSNVSLAEVVKAYGQPTHIRATFQRVETGQIMYTVNVLYLSQGFILFDGSKYQKPIIDNNLYFTRLGFFAPGMEGYKKAYPQEEYRYIVPWKGINTFDFYCQTQPRNGDEDCTKV